MPIFNIIPARRGRGVRITAGVAMLAAAMLAPTAALASGRPGPQAVLLLKWSSKSRSNLVDAVTAPGTPGTVEIGFCPIFRNAASDIYSGARSSFSTILSRRKFLYVVAHLGFKDVSDSDLDRRADDLNKNLIRKYSTRDRIVFVVSPCLEDRQNRSVFEQRVKRLASRLDWASIKSGRVLFRRSPESDGGGVPDTIRVTQGRESATVRPELEIHGEAPSDSSKAWSNDGLFVYSEQPGHNENELSCPSCTGTAKTVGMFTDESRARSGPSLLWRPAYNLFRKTGSNPVVWLKEPADANVRTDSDRAPAFDTRERDILIRFLQGQ